MESSPPLSWRSWLRAGLISFGVLAHLVYSLPLPNQISEEDLNNEGAQRDLATWQWILGEVGIELSTEQIGQIAMSGSTITDTVHETMKAPFKPFMRAFRLGQSWGLFASVTEKPEALVVQIKVDGAWHPVHRSLDRTAAWRWQTFKYRRIRGVWDGAKEGKRNPDYRRLARWAADRAFEDFPQAVEVRVQQEQRTLGLPWQDPNDEITVLHRRSFKRPAP